MYRNGKVMSLDDVVEFITKICGQTGCMDKLKVQLIKSCVIFIVIVIESNYLIIF